MRIVLSCNSGLGLHACQFDEDQLHRFDMVPINSLPSVRISPEDLHRVGILNTSSPIDISHASQLCMSQYIPVTTESEMHYGHLILDQASLGVDTHMAFSNEILMQARFWLQSARYRVYAETMGRWQVPAQNPFSVNQAFLLATRNGGLAVKRDDLGAIRVAATADLVVWEGRSPVILGWTDPVAAVILHTSVGHIRHVLVDAEFRKRDGRPTDNRYYDEVQDRFLASARQDPVRGSQLIGPSSCK
ncbi:amidohydrolase [Apiospora aurea]|uniref:Amidohydrolase n=1 Tax=Apiospora aurea TaxID=335848 RepID=A0ABR1QST2_9PEZI